MRDLAGRNPFDRAKIASCVGASIGVEKGRENDVLLAVAGLFADLNQSSGRKMGFFLKFSASTSLRGFAGVTMPARNGPLSGIRSMLTAANQCFELAVRRIEFEDNDASTDSLLGSKSAIFFDPVRNLVHTGVFRGGIIRSCSEFFKIDEGAEENSL